MPLSTVFKQSLAIVAIAPLMVACSTTTAEKDAPDTSSSTTATSPDNTDKESNSSGLGTSGSSTTAGSSSSSSSSGSSVASNPSSTTRTSKSIPDGWAPVVSPEGGYSIAMPSDPSPGEQQVPLPNGQTAPLKTLSVEKNNIAYFTGHIDYPAGVIAPGADTQELLGTAIEASVIPIKGSSGLQQKVTTVDGVPCRAFNTTGEVASEPAQAEGVYCFEGNRLYQVLVLGEQSNSGFSGQAKQFIGSFKITKS